MENSITNDFKKPIESGSEYTYSNESGDCLEFWHKADGPNWAGKYQGYFNGEFFSYKTWDGFKTKVNKFIEKYDLERSESE